MRAMFANEVRLRFLDRMGQSSNGEERRSTIRYLTLNVQYFSIFNDGVVGQKAH